MSWQAIMWDEVSRMRLRSSLDVLMRLPKMMLKHALVRSNIIGTCWVCASCEVPGQNQFHFTNRRHQWLNQNEINIRILFIACRLLSFSHNYDITFNAIGGIVMLIVSCICFNLQLIEVIVLLLINPNSIFDRLEGWRLWMANRRKISKPSTKGFSSHKTALCSRGA